MENVEREITRSPFLTSNASSQGASDEYLKQYREPRPAAMFSFGDATRWDCHRVGTAGAGLDWQRWYYGGHDASNCPFARGSKWLRNCASNARAANRCWPTSLRREKRRSVLIADRRSSCR